MRSFIAALVLLLAGQQHGANAQTPASNLPDAFESIAADVTIERNGEIEVVSTVISRVAGHKTIGLRVTFPLRGDPCANPPRYVGGRILSVTRNGKPEKYVLERPPEKERKPNVLIIGTKGQYLNDGDHVFVIRYRAFGQIRVSGRLDELHWNIAGSNIQIKSAIGRFRLPEPVEFENVAFFTGPTGSIKADGAVIERAPGRIVVAATSTLASKESLRVVLSWKKGVVNLPPPTEAEIAAAQKQRNQAKEFNCLTSSIQTFDLAKIIATEFSLWN